MTTKLDIAPDHDRQLLIARIIDAPRSAVWRCWTEPDLMKRWFVPRPWTITRAEFELRPGGPSLIVMADPDGNEYPNPGQYIEVVPQQRLVFTDAYLGDWKVSGSAFMTATMTLADEGAGRTRYIARADHWTREAVDQHIKMGFHEGWGIVADQLEDVARTL
jgi:uncharacterized protein YndB with AHSA1/START domain